MPSNPDPWADHEDGPDEFGDWDSRERTRPARVERSGVIQPPDPHRAFAPRWHALYGDDLPDDLEEGPYHVPGPEVAKVDPKYL